MTGPEHYREAERLMSAYGWENPINVAHAQVHATLALAAATALEAAGVPGDGATAQAWRTAICEAKPEPVTT